jgi:hypothetical protein
MSLAAKVHRSVLRRAAHRYADQGWSVIPGAVLAGGRFTCGPFCPTVACHPAVRQWENVASSNTSDVDGWWANDSFSVLLATGHAFDVIEVPASIGRDAAHPRIATRTAGVPHRRDRPAAVGPVAVTHTGRWMFLVSPGEALRPELAARMDLVLHGTGSWIPAPPTRTPEGRIRWEVHPSITGWQVPDAYAVQKSLVGALRPLGSRTSTFASSTPGLRRAA